MTAAVTPMVFIIDDDPSMRKSLTRIMTSTGYAVEAFASAREFLAREPFHGPCCLVLDVRMPDVTGLDLQEALSIAKRRMAIVFITGHGDIAMSVKAMKAGAVDFLTKPFDLEALLEAVERALAKDVTALGEEGRTATLLARVKLLTPRERQVFALVVTGMLNKQIAAELGVGEKTVKVHRARVMEKMEAKSVADLVRLADRSGIVVPKASRAAAP